MSFAGFRAGLGFCERGGVSVGGVLIDLSCFQQEISCLGFISTHWQPIITGVLLCRVGGGKAFLRTASCCRKLFLKPVILNSASRDCIVETPMNALLASWQNVFQTSNDPPQTNLRVKLYFLFREGSCRPNTYF